MGSTYSFATSVDTPNAVIPYMLFCKAMGIPCKPTFDNFGDFLRRSILDNKITPEDFKKLFGGDTGLVEEILRLQTESEGLVQLQTFFNSVSTVVLSESWPPVRAVFADAVKIALAAVEVTES